jgi:hypothetical protein
MMGQFVKAMHSKQWRLRAEELLIGGRCWGMLMVITTTIVLGWWLTLS